MSITSSGPLPPLTTHIQFPDLAHYPRGRNVSFLGYIHSLTLFTRYLITERISHHVSPHGQTEASTGAWSPGGPSPFIDQVLIDLCTCHQPLPSFTIPTTISPRPLFPVEWEAIITKFTIALGPFNTSPYHILVTNGLGTSLEFHSHVSELFLTQSKKICEVNPDYGAILDIFWPPPAEKYLHHPPVAACAEISNLHLDWFRVLLQNGKFVTVFPVQTPFPQLGPWYANAGIPDEELEWFFELQRHGAEIVEGFWRELDRGKRQTQISGLYEYGRKGKIIHGAERE
ncbi:hypothetical protein BDZ91DRAFT_784798 [Kalaharituber pfeilii]|nr:hypothetical protein BDZ91DRAFT_784798 [Kalaharituber pfeilii]